MGTGDSLSQAADQVAASWNDLLARDAAASVTSLLASFGASTEPDFRSVAPIYDRMLAIALLLTGAVIAFALIERLIGGPQGVGWNVIPRVLVAVFFAYSGLGVVQYLAGYGALLATAWSHDLGVIGLPVDQHVSAAGSAHWAAAGGPQVSLIGAILMALLLGLMAILVHLELVVRSALILLMTVFVPIVCALSIWPRLAPAAAHLGEFLIGLMLAKFVIATAIAVGFSLVIPPLVGAPASGGDWMGSGVAVLLIAAFSPMVLFQALRFAHGAAGALTRGWVGAGLGLLPWSSVIRVASVVIEPAKPRLTRAVQRAKERPTKAEPQ